MFAKKMNRMKAALLASAIVLSLSGSTVYAMPQGGYVAVGSVTGLTDGTVASGGTLTATSDAIINWNSFNIAQGESLTFNTEKYTLLNRVTGTGISTIAGILNQTGTDTCSAILVNPNGIVISGTATINASNLILSTLTLSDDQLMNGNTATFTQQGSTPALLSVEKGAKFHVRDLLLLAGGKVNVADGVTFSAGNSNNDDVMIENLAAQSFTVNKENESQDFMNSTTTTAANTMAFHGTFDNTSSGENTNFHIDGGTTNLDGATINLNKESELYATAGHQQDSETVPIVATSANVLSADGLTVNGGKLIAIVGGQTTLKNSTVKATSTDANITVASGTSFSLETNSDYVGKSSEDQVATRTADPSNVTTLIGTTVQNADNGEIHIDGGRTIVDNSKLTSEDTVIVAAVTKEVSDESDLTKNVSEGNTVTLKNGTTVTANYGSAYGYTVEQSPSVTFSTKKSLIADHTYSGTSTTPTTISDSATTGYATAATVDTTNTNNSSNNGSSIIKNDEEVQTEAAAVQGNVLTNATTQATQAASDLMSSGTGLSSSPVAATDTTETADSGVQVDGTTQDGTDISALEHSNDALVASTITAALQQGNEQFESFIQRNIEYGYHSMEDALTADTPDARMEQASALVSRIDGDKNMDEGAKLAQAYGMIQAVQDNSKMSAQEKTAVRNMIAKNFRSLSKDVRSYLFSVAGRAAQRNL